MPVYAPRPKTVIKEKVEPTNSANHGASHRTNYGTNSSFGSSETAGGFIFIGGVILSVGAIIFISDYWKYFYWIFIVAMIAASIFLAIEAGLGGGGKKVGGGGYGEVPGDDPFDIFSDLMRRSFLNITILFLLSLLVSAIVGYFSLAISILMTMIIVTGALSSYLFLLSDYIWYTRAKKLFEEH